MSAAKRFWSHVDRGDTLSCWQWTGSTDGRYGKFYDRHLTETWAHRISWTLHFDAIPEGMHVCHRCDNGLCVNPHHLFLGTAADNMADKVSKGRQPKGSEIPTAVLTERSAEQLLTEYMDGVPITELIHKYGVSRQSVFNILNGSTWAHITGAGNGPSRNPRKLTADKAQQLRDEYAAGGISYRQLARKYDLTPGNVGKVVRGELWRADR